MTPAKRGSKRSASGTRIDRLRVGVSDLRWRCDPGRFPFSCTDEIEPPRTFVGQERAAAALEVGLGITRPGFNIFVTGQSGTGRAPVVKAHLEESVKRGREAGAASPAHDWCYVFNFDEPDQPRAIQFAGGQAVVFAGRVTEVLETLTRDLRNAFQSEAYQSESKRFADETNSRRQEIMSRTERYAFDHGFAVQVSPVGVSIVPLADGRPMEQDRFLAMSAAERKQLDGRRQDVAARVEAAMGEMHAIEQERQDAARQLVQAVAENTIKFPFDALEAHYTNDAETIGFLQGLRAYTLDNIQVFLQDGQDEAPSSARAQLPRVAQDPRLPFRVNVFVSNPDVDGAPIVEENNPNYATIFGHIERRPYLGTYVTDHTMLHPGALVRANGGYLVVQARPLLRQPGVWESLKRVLKGGEVRPEDPAEVVMPGLVPQSLRPEPIPINTKVILIGDDELYHLLAAYDEDFWEIFKVRADFGFLMENSDDNVNLTAALVCGMVQRHAIRHVDRGGVAEIIEHSSRIAGDRLKLSTRFGFIRDLVIEADYWARQDGTDLIEGRHVRRAIDQRIFRTSRISDAIREMMVKGVLLVDLKGAKVGQVNGLAVYDLGDVSFGKPSRITARTFMGRQGVVNIEREARLSGSTYDKGVLILSGLLGARYAEEFPLALNVSLAFEQSYEGVDGDSASAAELLAIISSLSGQPINQAIAITGSVNQMGQIQAIGGVNQKVEGFFDVCREAGMLGAAGVVIPKANLPNLALRHDVVEAVEEGRFTVYAIESIDEGIEVLTGQPSARVDSLVKERLRQMAEGMREHGWPR